MRQLVRIHLLVVLLLLGACASPVTPSGSTADSHLGLAFPPEIASLSLRNVHVYDDAAHGAVANYRLASADSLIVSVYVYPTPTFEDGSLQSLDAHSQDELRGLLKHYEGAKQVEWPFTGDGPDDMSADFRQAALHIDDEERGTFYSLLRIVDYGDVRMKFRISYPPTHQSAALHIESFLRAYPGRRAE